ncbi:MAG: urease accessory protein UreE [Synechococcales bacterium]|nr:urease accessory protein UreE [Synechococcales bacterium]
MLTVSRRLPPDATAVVAATLSLTAEERTRSRHSFQADPGLWVHLHLPRGTVLAHGDLLAPAEADPVVRVVAKPEPVMTVRATNGLDLLRAAYHLGNRHISLEVAPSHLRLSPDPVLQQMLEQMGLTVVDEVCPFQPEAGAYASPSASSMGHRH